MKSNVLPFLLIAGLVIVIAVAVGTSFWRSNDSLPLDDDFASEPAGDRAASTPKSIELPRMMRLPEFQLTDQSGADFSSLQLVGKAWVGNFMFTRCQLTCPRQTARLVELQTQLRDQPIWKDVALVSISVDPGHDSPDVLARYAEANGADTSHWRFLTGPRESIIGLSEDGFKLAAGGVSGDPKMPISHAPDLVLVDPVGVVRGFYQIDSDADMRRLPADLRSVLAEQRVRPADLLHPAWLDRRRQAQIQAAASLDVPHDFIFRDRIRESGITYRHRCVDDAGRTYVAAHYDHGNGLVVADVDGDGLIDIYFVNQVGAKELWRNLGGGRFENITDRAGVALPDRIGSSAAAADVDNDGDVDLYVTTILGGNVLFQNDGTGRFRDVTSQAGLDYVGHSSSAVFFDYNRDGWLDLFLVNVGVFTTDEDAVVSRDAFTGADPTEHHYHRANKDAFAAHLKPERSENCRLYENQGDGRFVDVTDKMRLVMSGWTGDASPLDVNQDGWLDLYVTNMQGHDEYLENVGGQGFTRKSRDRFPSTPWGTMGIKVLDADGDGQLDLFLTDMHTDMLEALPPEREEEKIDKKLFDPVIMATDGNHVMGNALFLARGKNAFEEASDRMGVECFWPWGVSAGDLNADGFEDLFITAGMNFPYRYATNRLLLNDRGQRFVPSEFTLGVEPRRGGRAAIPWFELRATGEDRNHPLFKSRVETGPQPATVVVWGALGSRSSAILDLDNDGDLDLVTHDFNSEPMILVSDLAERHPELRHVKIKLVGQGANGGGGSNRDGLGAVVTIRCGDHAQTKVLDGKSGYLSQSRDALYFGLGTADTIDEVTVRWPTGRHQRLSGPLEVNRQVEITEQR